MSTAPTWRLDSESPTRVLTQPAPNGLDDASSRLPDGAYTTFRTYDDRTRVIALSAHLDRLDDSAAQLGQRNGLNRTRLRHTLADLLDQMAPAEARVRITVDTTETPGTVYISLEELRTPPAEAYERGVCAVTHEIRREQPTAKSTEFIHPSRKLKKTLPAEIFEIIMYDDDGYILEGTTSNIFSVRDGIVRTAGTDILFGITRSVVLELARGAGIPVEERKIHMDEVSALDEAFLTSSSRGIVPIVQIDEHSIGDGSPGKITRRLMRRYREHIDDVTEPILPD